MNKRKLLALLCFLAAAILLAAAVLLYGQSRTLSVHLSPFLFYHESASSPSVKFPVKEVFSVVYSGYGRGIGNRGVRRKAVSC